MRRLRGYVIQIIKPEKLGHFIEPSHGFIDGKFHLTIIRPGVPKNRFKRFFHTFRNRNQMYEHVALDSCPYRKGDWIDIEVENFYKKTRLLIEAKNRCL